MNHMFRFCGRMPLLLRRGIDSPTQLGNHVVIDHVETCLGTGTLI